MDYSRVPNTLASCALGLRTLTDSFRDLTGNATTRLGEVLILILTFTFIIYFLSYMIITESLMFPARANARLRLLSRIGTRRGFQHETRSVSLMCLTHI